MVDLARVRALDPEALRAYLGDGNYGGRYQRSDDDMLAHLAAGAVPADHQEDERVADGGVLLEAHVAVRHHAVGEAEPIER